MVDLKILFKDNFILSTLNQMFLDKNCGAKCQSISESPKYLVFYLDLENNIKTIIRLPIDPLLDIAQMKALDDRAGISNISNEEARIKLRILFANLECVQMVKFVKAANQDRVYKFSYNKDGLING